MQIFESQGKYYSEKYIFRHKRGEENFPPDSLGFYAWFDSEFKPGLQFTSGGGSEYYVVSYVTAGAFSCSPEGKEKYTVSEGEFTLSGNDSGIRTKNATIGHSSCFRKCFLLYRTPFVRQVIHLFFPEGTVRKKVADPAGVERLMDRIREAFLRSPEQSDALLCGLLAELLESVRREDPAPITPPPPPRRLLEKAIGCIDRELGNPALNREMITREINCSISTLNRLFHRGFNCSVNHYITEQRLKRAQEMLLLPTLMRVKEVAEAAGFGSVIYMNRLFRKHFGLSPCAYRVKWSLAPREKPHWEDPEG